MSTEFLGLKRLYKFVRPDRSLLGDRVELRFRLRNVEMCTRQALLKHGEGPQPIDDSADETNCSWGNGCTVDLISGRRKIRFLSSSDTSREVMVAP